MYKNTSFVPIEQTTETRISPPPIKPNPIFGFSFGFSSKRPADTNIVSPQAKKQCRSQ